TEALKQHLIANDTHFAELVNTHREYDKRLIELEELHYPSTEEQMEEAMLKRKKLQLKDEMEAIMRRYKEQHQTAGY
ncbi:MAG TPA: YdcH family protein, partial [Blastocatellia bacterium]